MSTKKIIVIGSGFGGIAAALRMKAKGYSVTLIEKHPDLGGRARVFKKEGFTFDAGPTVITAPNLLEELFALFNKNISDYVKIIPLKLWYRFVFDDKSSFDYSGDEELMKKEIEKYAIDDFVGYQKLVKLTEKIFDKGFTELSSKPFNNISFMLKQVPALLKLKSYKSVYELISTYISDNKLRKIFSMHPLLVGGNPFTTTSIYTLILFLEKKWGIHYSLGGTGNLVKAFERLMKEEKIEIIKNSSVTELTNLNNQIVSVTVNNKDVLKADYIICNSDPPNVYKNLIKPNNYGFLFNKKIERMNYSMGSVCLLFWVKKTIQ